MRWGKSEVNNNKLNISSMRNKQYSSSKYQYGYQPKINYWKFKWNQALETGDVEMALRAEWKVQYFTQRQLDVYGHHMVVGNVI